MTVKHSPGPWSFQVVERGYTVFHATPDEFDSHFVEVRDCDNGFIAIVERRIPDGNAALIASAPELRRKLDRLLAAVETADYLILSGVVGVEAVNHYKELRAAVADCKE